MKLEGDLYEKYGDVYSLFSYELSPTKCDKPVHQWAMQSMPVIDLDAPNERTNGMHSAVFKNAMQKTKDSLMFEHTKSKDQFDKMLARLNTMFSEKGGSKAQKLLGEAMVGAARQLEEVDEPTFVPGKIAAGFSFRDFYNLDAKVYPEEDKAS